MVTRSRSDSWCFAILTARTSTTSRSQPCTSTGPFTFCSSNVPPGCKGYVWSNCWLSAAKLGTAANERSNANRAETNRRLRSIARTPFEDDSANCVPGTQTKACYSARRSAQVKLHGNSGNYVHPFAAHGRGLAAPGFDTGNCRIYERRLRALHNLFHLHAAVLLESHLQTHAPFHTAFSCGHRIRRTR